MTQNKHPASTRRDSVARPQGRGSPYRRYGLVAAIAAVVIVALLVWKLDVPWFAAWLLAMGAVTFGLYVWDKFRARAGGGRVPEAVLMALVLAGGVIGGWAGMLLLRHKTRHTSFWVVQWVATLLWAAVLLWLVVG